MLLRLLRAMSYYCHVCPYANQRVFFFSLPGDVVAVRDVVARAGGWKGLERAESLCGE